MLGVRSRHRLHKFRGHLLGGYIGEILLPESSGKQLKDALLGKIRALQQNLVYRFAAFVALEKPRKLTGIDYAGSFGSLYKQVFHIYLIYVRTRLYVSAHLGIFAETLQGFRCTRKIPLFATMFNNFV